MIFIDRYKAMKCDFKDIHKAIDFWHKQYKGDLQLHEMLGLTFDEYSHFVEDEDSFKEYMYNTYADSSYELEEHWDNSGIDLLNIVEWHKVNNDKDYLDIKISITPKNLDDDLDEDDF